MKLLSAQEFTGHGATQAETTNQTMAANVFPRAGVMNSVVTRPEIRRKTKWILFSTVIILAALVSVAAIIVHHYWPFSESAVREDLAADTGSHVHFGAFHQTYFPPGFVAENVVFQRDDSPEPLMTAQKLTVRAYLGGMFRNHVNLVKAEGLHAILGRSDFNKSNYRQRQTSIVDRLVADDAMLEIRRNPSQPNLRFVLHKFTMKNLGEGGTVEFAAMFENPMPRGVIQTSGQFGPWNSAHGDQTAVSGKYSLEQADLSVFGGIGGTISSTGNFHGTFKQMEIAASTSSSEFEITKTHHGLPLETRFSASVNATDGEVALHQVAAKFGRNVIEAQGMIGRDANGKRAAILDLRCEHGRIEDVFYPFIHSAKSPLTGDVRFAMKVTIPSGRKTFLEKLDLRSNFEIHNARFTKERTQQRLNQIAEGPKQKDPTETLSDFQGTVAVSAGVARFSSLSVHDQGAAAVFHGSFGLIDERVNMYGNLKTATSLTKATSGISAVFAKVLEPFFKKKPHETVVPVKIGGTYSHPSFGLNM